jgi:hypothetical protein
MTYYEIATDARGRINLCTGQLERRGCGIKRTSVPGTPRAGSKLIRTTLNRKSYRFHQKAVAV